MKQLCKVGDVMPDSPLAVDCDGLPPLAVYCVEATYFVTDNLCTHGEAVLTEGCQEGTTIECPFHLGTFDVRTGEATGFPCTVPLKTYPVTVIDGWIWITI